MSEIANVLIIISLIMLQYLNNLPFAQMKFTSACMNLLPL